MATWQQQLPSMQVNNSNAPGNQLPQVPQYQQQPTQGQQILGGLQSLAQTYAGIKQQEQQKQFQQAFGAAYASGDREALKKLAASNPQQLESIQKAMGFVDADHKQAVADTSMQLQTAAALGPEAVAKVAARNAPTLERLGVTPAGLMEAYQKDPAQLTKMADLIGLQSVGPEKYFDLKDKAANRDVTMRGQDIGADTARRAQDISAQTARQGQQLSYASSLRGHDIAAQRLALDQQKFGLELQQAKQKADALINDAPKLSVNMEKTITTAMDQSAASRGAADSMSALANQFRQEQPRGGILGTLQNKFETLTGSDSTLRDLRIRQSALINSQVLKFLPPGPATDRDIEIVRQGAPTQYDSPEVVARWLDAMSNLERRSAAFNDFKAEWISANGNPGQARKASSISGIDVEKGLSFNEAAKRYMAQQEANFGGSSTAPAQQTQQGQQAQQVQQPQADPNMAIPGDPVQPQPAAQQAPAGGSGGTANYSSLWE